MRKQFILFFLPVLFLISCGQTVQLSEEDYSWMPYKGNETLVFKSNTGDTDTMFFIKKDTLWGYSDPASGISKYEAVAIFSKHADPNMLKEYRYLEGSFLEVKKTMSMKAELVINLSAKDARFYRLRPIKIDSLNKINSLSFATSYKQYGDVYIFEPEDFLGNLHERSNYVTKVYWSKSGGLIRYDKKDGVYWELMK